MRFSPPPIPPQKTPKMTLRQYFAGQALIGLLSYDSARGYSPGMKAVIAKEAYSYADAMIAEGLDN